MSLTETITTTEYSQSILLNSTPERPQDVALFELEPEVLVDMALHRLQSAGMQIIEWGSTLHRRMHVPVIPQHFSYIVYDNKLEAASNILADMGLPRSTPPGLLLDTSGDFFTKGCLHRLTQCQTLGAVQYLILYPLSFSSFSASELTSAPRLTSFDSPRCHTIIVPRQSAVYASILRIMLAYPRFGPTRSTLKSDLCALVGYDLYGLQDGYVDVDDEKLCEELQVDRRVDDATQIVKGWGWDGEWRDGEEWMGDALAAVVKGSGEIGNLPWATS